MMTDAYSTTIPFIGPSYFYPELPLAVQSSVNYYLETTGNEARSPVALRGCPGLVPEFENLDGEVLNIFKSSNKNVLFVATTKNLYQIQLQENITKSIASLVGYDDAYLIENINEILVTNRPCAVLKGYAIIPNDVKKGIVYNKFTGVTSIISGGEFNATTNRNQLFISGLENFLSYDQLEFDSADIKPDPIVGIVTVQTQAVVFCQTSTEFWFYSGASDFPFNQQDGATLDKGCASHKTIAVGDSTVFWLGNDNSVYMLNGVSELRISNPAIETFISQETNQSEISGFYHHFNGHKFYSISLPRARKTFLFDVNLVSNPNIAWHERETFNKSLWRANSFAFHDGKHYVGDRYQGKVHTLSRLVYTDDGGILRAIRTGNYLHASNRRIEISEFQLTLNNGEGLSLNPNTNAKISLSFSKDGGRMFSKEITKNLGVSGEYLKKVRWKNVSSSRESVSLRTMITSDTPRDIVASSAVVNVGL